MDSNNFPAQWSWVALIIGVLAFLVAILPFIRMMWGGPKILLHFRIEDMENNCYYSCEIHNIPIRNRLLKALGVRRETAQDVTAAFEIEERGTGKTICPITQALIKTQTRVGAERILLPASFFPALFAIVFIEKGKSEVRVMREDKLILPIGNYTAKVRVFAGEDKYISKCNFVVDNKHPFVLWDIKS
jgi:hypothetical protein